MVCITCATCKHFLTYWVCDAFPNGIPPEVITGEHDHATTPYPGDNGIMYEPGIHPKWEAAIKKAKDEGILPP